MNKIVGKNEAIENNVELRYSPTDGWSGVWTKEGPKEAVRAVLQQLVEAGYAFSFRYDQSPKAAVTYQTVGAPGNSGGPETPTLNWEYFASRAEIDVLEVDLTAVSGIVDADKRKIRDAINTPDPDNAPSLSGNALAVYQLMLGGVRGFRINVPTLRVSKLVSGSYGVKASLTNVGRIITTATLGVQENIPNTILFELPSFTTAKTGFAYAWYKAFPNVQQAGGNKWNVSQEWEYGLWPTLLYQAAL